MVNDLVPRNYPDADAHNKASDSYIIGSYI